MPMLCTGRSVLTGTTPIFADLFRCSSLSRADAARHNAGVNTLLADGHAKWRKATELMELPSREFKR